MGQPDGAAGSTEASPALVQRTELGAGAWLEWRPTFLPDASTLKTQLLEELPLRGECLRIHGREVPVPRMVSWHGAPGCAYRYSGQTHAPLPFTPTLARLRERLRRALDLDFNGVLANYYRDGRDSMGYHADDEPELGPKPGDVAIASLSLGGTRRFLLKHKASGELRKLELSDGSLLVMRGTTQQLWRHALPKTRRSVVPRLNLTFRILTPQHRPAGNP